MKKIPLPPHPHPLSPNLFICVFLVAEEREISPPRAGVSSIDCAQCNFPLPPFFKRLALNGQYDYTGML